MVIIACIWAGQGNLCILTEVDILHADVFSALVVSELNPSGILKMSIGVRWGSRTMDRRDGESDWQLRLSVYHPAKHVGIIGPQELYKYR